MRIIDIRNKLEVRSQKSEVIYLLLLLTFDFLLCTALSGCAHKFDLKQAREYDQQSTIYYRKSIATYKDLIAQGKGLDNLYFQLGSLYYRHADFDLAITALKRSKVLEANKILAFSYYQLGRFTDALEVFNQHEFDDEYLYYYGLTCEKLNLFDQALSIYAKITNKQFSNEAKKRIEAIAKRSATANIKDIDPEVAAILAKAPSASEYPQAGALILSCNEKVEITSDDKEATYIHYVVKILNERGKEKFSETQIGYDSTYEKIELEYARTIQADGAVTQVGSRHIRDVSRYLNFPLYSNARVYIISFPEVSEGTFIEYKLKISRNQLVNKKDFVMNYPLQASEPIISADFSLVVPKEKNIHIKKINENYNDWGANFSADIKTEEGRLIYNWHFSKIPQIIPEANMPPEAEINPTFLISTFSSWAEVYNWWFPKAKDKIIAGEEIKQKAKELTEGKASDEEKIKAIYNFCAQKIRYVAVEYGQAGYEPHKADDVFKNRYGDCKDKAILLIAMLREVKIKAYPVLIATKDCHNLLEDFPSILFNHCIAAVSLKDEMIFLDPTAETCAFGDLPSGDQGRKVLIFKDNECEIKNTPLYPPTHNYLKQALKIKINPREELSAEKEVFTYGAYDQAERYWFLYTPPELIQEQLKEKIQNISIGAKLDKYQIKNLESLDIPVVLTYKFQGSEYFTQAGALRVLPQLASVDSALTARDKRKYPIDFGILDYKETLFEIEAPDNFIVEYLPKTTIQDNPWFNFSAEYKSEGNKIIFKQNMYLKKSLVDSEEYLAFKELYESLAKNIKQRIILRAK